MSVLPPRAGLFLAGRARVADRFAKLLAEHNVRPTVPELLLGW